MNTTRTVLFLATVLAVASARPTELRAQEASDPRASCEAVFKALQNRDEKAFQATLPSAESLETAYRAAGFGERLREPGAAANVRNRMLRAATERFVRTHDAAGKRFDWPSARFLTEIPPAPGKSGFEIAPLAFLVHADGKVWQFGGKDVMRSGSDWSFAEGPFFQGLCDPNAMAVLQAERDSALEREDALQSEIEAMRLDMRARGDDKTRAMESLERELRREFEQSMRGQQNRFEESLRQGDDLLAKAQRDWSRQMQTAYDESVKTESSLEEKISKLQDKNLQLRADVDELIERGERQMERDAHTIYELTIELDALRAAVKRLQPDDQDPLTEAQRQQMLDTTLSISVPKIEVDDLLLCVGRATGLAIAVGTEALLEDRVIEVGSEANRSARAWLELATANHESGWRDGVLWVGRNSDPDGSRSISPAPTFLQKKMLVREEFTPVEDALQSIRDESAIRVWISNRAADQHSGLDIELRSSAPVPITAVLDLIAETTVTRWTMVGDVVYWHEDKFETPSKTPAVPNVRRSIERESESVQDRFAALSKIFGAELLVSAKLAKKIEDITVELLDCKQRDIDFVTVLTLLELDLEEDIGMRLQWRAQGQKLVLGAD